jgi:hypothetical protein
MATAKEIVESQTPAIERKVKSYVGAVVFRPHRARAAARAIPERRALRPFQLRQVALDQIEALHNQL